MNARETLRVNERGHLEIGGADCTELAERFGTPLYVFDEAHIRKMMRIYRGTIEREYEGNGKVLYASKAFSCEAIYRIADSENRYRRRFGRRTLYGAESGISRFGNLYARKQ